MQGLSGAARLRQGFGARHTLEVSRSEPSNVWRRERCSKFASKFHSKQCCFQRVRIPPLTSSNNQSHHILLIQKHQHGGERGIRTLDTRERMLVFKTSAFNRSAISPLKSLSRLFKGDPAIVSTTAGISTSWDPIPQESQPYPKTRRFFKTHSAASGRNFAFGLFFCYKFHLAYCTLSSAG